MYDLYKVQCELLKNLIKPPKNFRVAWAELNDGKLAVTYGDANVLYIAPKDKWFVAFGENQEQSKIKRLVEPLATHELAKSTGEMREIKDGGIAIKYENSTNHAWFNEKFLKKFGSNFDLYIANRTSPALVYENDEHIGLICPVNME